MFVSSRILDMTALGKMEKLLKMISNLTFINHFVSLPPINHKHLQNTIHLNIWLNVQAKMFLILT